MASWQRTHTCGELRETHIGQTVTLNGWVNTYRMYADQVFVDLRDRYGITQVVFEADGRTIFARVRSPQRMGAVDDRQGARADHRGKQKHNPKLATGAIEVQAESVRVLNRCPTPPFEVISVPQEGQTFGEPELANEDLRLAVSLSRSAPADACSGRWPCGIG